MRQGDAMTPKSPLTRRARRGERGAAYAETVVMLPFFIAVWACIIYVHNGYAEKERLMAQNRNCVMTYAFTACRTVVPGCSVSTSPSPEGAAGGSEVSGFLGALRGFGDTVLSSIVGGNANSRMTSSVGRPPLLGGGSTSVLAGNSMLCNTVYHDNPVRSIADAFSHFLGGLI